MSGCLSKHTHRCKVPARRDPKRALQTQGESRLLSLPITYLLTLENYLGSRLRSFFCPLPNLLPQACGWDRCQPPKHTDQCCPHPLHFLLHLQRRNPAEPKSDRGAAAWSPHGSSPPPLRTKPKSYQGLQARHLCLSDPSF